MYIKMYDIVYMVTASMYLSQQAFHCVHNDTQLKQKLEQSMSDSSQQTEHLFALKQAVQEQEAELRTLQQKLDSQETAFQMELQKKLEKMEQKVRLFLIYNLLALSIYLSKMCAMKILSNLVKCIYCTSEVFKVPYIFKNFYD